MFSLTKLYITIGVIITILALGYFWKKDIEKIAELKAQQLQYQQVIKDQQLYIQNLAVINQSRSLADAELSIDNQTIVRQAGQFEAFIDSSKDGPSSLVLKDTIKRLAGK